MRFYTDQHKFYCGIDLHARSMYLCILDQEGKTMLHRNYRTTPDDFLRATQPYREDVVVAVECMFVWYWLADLCTQEAIPFVLGHALYMKAIHGGKSKNDKIDSKKIAALLRGGTLPVAYVYPMNMRSTRDLLRRRNHLMQKRSELLAHIQNTNSQYHLPEFGKKLAYKSNRDGVTDHFPDPSVQKSIEVNLQLIDVYDRLLTELELYIVKQAKGHNVRNLYLLRSIPGIGKILSLILLYEIHNINRFPASRTSSPIAALSNAPENQEGKSPAPRTAKSATPISNGPSLRPPVSSSEEMNRLNSITIVWSASTAREKRFPFLPIKSAGPFTSCSNERNRSVWIPSLLVHNSRGGVGEPNA